MKALTTKMFESILSDDTTIVWTSEEPEPTSFAGPRIQTVWGWGG